MRRPSSTRRRAVDLACRTAGAGALPLFLFVEGRENSASRLTPRLPTKASTRSLRRSAPLPSSTAQTIVDERDPSIRTETIRLHRLVRQVAADRCIGEARDHARRRPDRGLRGGLSTRVSDPGDWPGRGVLTDRRWRCVRRRHPRRGDAASRVLEGLAAYRHHALGAYAQARPLYARALALREKALGPEHPDTAETLNNLALLQRDEGDHAAARPLLERALAINEKACGPDHGRR